MKKYSFSLIILSLLCSAMLLTACMNHLYLYEGEPRLELEEGTLTVGTIAQTLMIIRVDGIDPGRINSGNTFLHLLSGEHTVFVSPTWSLLYYEKGSKTDEKKALARKIAKGWLLQFTVEPGHNYLLGVAGSTELNPGKAEFLIEGQDSVLVEYLWDWETWTPYIRNEVNNNRVSEIVSERP